MMGKNPRYKMIAGLAFVGLSVLVTVGMGFVSCRKTMHEMADKQEMKEDSVAPNETEAEDAPTRSEKEIRDSLQRMCDEVVDAPFRYWYEVRKGKHWGVLSHEGEVLLPCRYDTLECWQELHFGFTYYAVRERGMWGVWDYVEKVMITPCLYDKVTMGAWDAEYMKVCKDGKWGLHHKNVYVKPQFDEVTDSYAEEATFFVRQGGKAGVIDTTGTWVIAPKYEDFAYARVDCYPFLHNGKWGVVDAKGKEVLPFTYDKLVSGCDRWNLRCMVLRKGDKWGVFDAERRKLYPFVFDDAEFLEDFNDIMGFVYHWYNLRKDSIVYQLEDMKADGKMKVIDGREYVTVSYPK